MIQYDQINCSIVQLSKWSKSITKKFSPEIKIDFCSVIFLKIVWEQSYLGQRPSANDPTIKRQRATFDISLPVIKILNTHC